MIFTRYQKLLMWLKNSGLDYITAPDLAKLTGIKRNHASTDLRKCWKMNLLTRKRFKRKEGGVLYRYAISEWGYKFLGNYDPDYIENRVYEQMKLLDYIIKSHNESDRVWAENFLIPRIEKRLKNSSALWRMVFLRQIENLLDVIKNQGSDTEERWANMYLLKMAFDTK